MIYLDNNASTRLDPEVREAMAAALDLYGNPSSVHSDGRRARRAIEEARDEVALLIGARTDEIFFTSGGTEANALAILGSVAGGPGRVVTSAVEHPSVREPLARLCEVRGLEAVAVSPDRTGALDAGKIRDAAVAGTLLVSLMAANNEYGGMYPVEEIAPELRSRGIPVHTDAVQAAGKVPVDARRWEVDLLSISAHKIHGPKGVGALYVRKGLALRAHTTGGGLAKRIRGGTENTEGNVGAGAPRLPNTSTVVFGGISGETLLFRLDLDGVAVSVGSACSSGALTPSPSILALGFPKEQAKGAVRFSLSRFTTAEEIDRVLDLLPRAAADVRDARRVAAAPISVPG